MTSAAPSLDVGEMQFLAGRAHRERGSRKAAAEHLAVAASATPPHLAAAQTLAAMLVADGYKREAMALIENVLCRAPAGSDIAELAALRRSCAEERIVVSIHQPSYLPWLGYFHKIYYADAFVVLDDVKYSKNSFIKRALVKKRDDQQAAAYLSIPLRKHSDFARINELVCADDEDWRAEHLRKIAAAYRATPYFAAIFPGLQRAFDATRGESSLVNITAILVTHLLALLDIDRPIVHSSSLPDCPAGQDAHERNLALVRRLGGNVYFSGSVARDYQEGKAVPDHMKLIYQDFWNFLESAPYVAREKFTNGLSVVDALFNIGPEAIIEMFRRYENPLVTRGHLFPEQPACMVVAGSDHAC